MTVISIIKYAESLENENSWQMLYDVKRRI
jgi:hypothetical protein